MSRGRLSVFLGICSVAMLVWVPSTSAAPGMCTAGDIQWPGAPIGDPQGVTATHLFAKVGDSWVEPEDVCVNIDVTTPGSNINQNSRLLTASVWNTVDGGFLETNLPAGTRISMGLDLPEGMLEQVTILGGQGGTVASSGDEIVIQADTAPWDWYPSSSFGSLDCTQQPVRWQSTFATNTIVNPAGDLRPQPFAGTFFETNAEHSDIPMLTFDADGQPTSIVLRVQGCGDDDPSSFEGYMDGFVPMSYFEALGMGKHLMRDIKLLQKLLEVRDLTTGEPVEARFEPVRADELALSPIPGVILPLTDGGSDYKGVRLETKFSYSERVLQHRARPSAVRAMRACRERGRTPAAESGRLVCLPRLAAAKTLRRGDRIAVFCAGRCTVQGNVVAGGTRLATGRGRRGDAGKVSVRLRTTAAGRRRLAARGSQRAKLVVTVLGGGAERARMVRRVRLTR